MKTLSQMLEEIEPPFVQSKLLKESAWVDRASYDRMKQVAIELAKACEEGSYWKKTDDVNGFAGECCADALSRAKDIIGGGDE